MNKRRILALLLGLCMIISLLPSVALATGPGEEAAASYPVYVHGGTLQKDGMTVRSGTEFPAGTVLTVTLDESLFSGHTFAYWLGSDGTQVPQKSFRMVVDRVTGFSPAFSDLTGNFGDWKVLEKGTLCTDGTLYVCEDSAQGLKEYRFERGYHNTYTYEPLNDDQHTVRCADCPYTNVNTHGWNSGVVTTEATCAAEGVKTFTCNQCGATKTEAIEKKTSHSYPYYPKDSDYEIIKSAVGSAPGKRALKCSVCGQPGTEREYITAKLPNKSGVQHYKLTLESNYIPSSSLNRGRIEEHYFTDNAYYYAVKRVASSRGFMLLWFDEGENSPVYIRSATKNSDGGFSATDAYGTPESNYYGILCYVDSREEFVELISHWSGIYTYDNGRSTSYLYNTVDGYRTFEKLCNEDPSQFTLKDENHEIPTWNEPVKYYVRTYGGRECEYFVNQDNACVRQWDGTERVWFTYDTRETFPFSKPERDKITWFSYYVMDGSYGYVYDDYYFGMASKDWSVENRKVTPRDAATGKAFSHWETYDPRTWQWEYCSDQAIWTPLVTNVTTLRAIYKDVTYHIKVNGGYYQISTGWNKWSDEKYPEGDVKYGTTIKIDYDRSQIPEGKEVACIIDEATGKQPDSYEITVKANGEYTVTYQPETAYFSPQVENGVVKKDGEEFSGGRFPIGSTVTLTTEGDAGYTYFKGWCRVRDGSSKTYTVLSTDTTYTAEITKDDDSRQITAVWRDTEDPLPKPAWHNVTIANGFARSDNRGIAVSALRAQDDSYILVIRDPTLKRDVKRWELTDADGDGTVLVQQDYQEYGNYFEISGASGGGKYDGKYDGKGGKDPVPGGSPANILITGVFKQYCIHTCTTCGGCTDSTDTCGVTKCICTTEAKPLPTTTPTTQPTGYLNGVLSNEIKVVAVEVDDIEANKDNPYVSYALQAAEGYKVDKIYDISLQGADGQKYTLNDNQTATITLTIGTKNAQLIDEGTLVLIHITDTGRVIYGKEATSGQKKFDKVDTANGTVTFTTDSCSPFVLAHKAGVSVKGKVVSYNGSHDFTVTLYQAGSKTMVGTPLTVSGNKAIGSTEQEFTIPNVPAGTYDLVVTKDAHLKYTVKNVEVGSTDLDLTARTDKPFSTITLLCGDVDGNGSINVTDLNTVWDAANFNKDVSSATNKLTDLNGDGNVNVTDLNILWDVANFNKGTDNCTFQFK